MVVFISYYHVIFTLIHEFSGFMRLYQQEVYGLLIKFAADSILKLASDPHYVGGLVAEMAVLHTWCSNLSYHLHVFSWPQAEACRRMDAHGYLPDTTI
jgi:hypothetical protein